MAYDPSYAQYIDHTVLKADTTQESLLRFCSEAKQYHFASVCVNPCNVAFVARQLEGSGVKTAAVVGFPLGANKTGIKAAEAREAIADGASEIDMVINVAALKDGEEETVYQDILAVRKACEKKTLKVIIETCLLTDEEKRTACRLAEKAGADFVKTSTGFSTGGATAEDVALMRGEVGTRLGVKASGGIRDKETAQRMIDAGASRLGTSATIAICS